MRALPWILVVASVAGLAASNVASMPDTVRIPPVNPIEGRTPAAPALFRHTTHAQVTCYGCHPALFPRYRVGFTHAQMRTGRYCGGCHDGGTAFAIDTAPCERCHVPD